MKREAAEREEKTRQQEEEQRGSNCVTLEKTLSIKGSTYPFMFLL